MKQFSSLLLAMALAFAPAAFAQFKKGMTPAQVEAAVAADLKKPGANADSIAKAALAAGIDAGTLTVAMINNKVAGDVAVQAVIRAGGDVVAVVNAALNAGVPVATVTIAAKKAGANPATVDNAVAQRQPGQPGGQPGQSNNPPGNNQGTPQGGGGSASPSGRG